MEVFSLGSDYELSPGGVTALFALCYAASITHVAKFSWEHVLVSGVLPIRRTSICYLIRGKSVPRAVASAVQLEARSLPLAVLIHRRISLCRASIRCPIREENL